MSSAWYTQRRYSSLIEESRLNTLIQQSIMNSQTNQTVEVINEANLSVSFISKVKFEDDNFFFWKAKPSNVVFYAPIEPYDKYRLGIKFENTGNYLKDYSFMGNQVSYTVIPNFS